tara:strand:+ start:809 stop:2644 length:1836 start_codon:yes stop_codon:yes gene_type:complete
MAIIGISCFFHDSAAALISKEGKILAAVQEERFTRKKHDSRFPFCSIDYCVKIAKENNEEIEAYVYYEKPIRVFMRLLETYFSTAPRGITSFLPAMKSWMGEKLFTKENISKEISLIDNNFSEDKLYFNDHHHSHACSAYYPSPFDKSIILCLDAVGEWATTSAWKAKGNDIKPLWEINFPDSLGMLYTSFTYYCGFKVNSGEYKLMGLAPYGEPKYEEIIFKNLIDLKEDGSFKLNMKYFKYHRGLKMISSKFIRLFGQKARLPKEPISQFYMDIAASIQKVTEDVILKIIKDLKKRTDYENLCLAGGVALNCVANGKILENSGFKKIWIQPAAGDAGNALGCALSYFYRDKKKIRKLNYDDDMGSAYLGPEFNNEEIYSFLKSMGLKKDPIEGENLFNQIAEKLSKGKIVAWFQGRMEYGPRALGNRSILGDPRIKEMQKKMNLKIKNRESFRPFAPAIIEEFQEEYFDLKQESPYMLITRKLNKKFLFNHINKDDKINGLDQVNQIRSSLPAITHIDNSCRVQTVNKKRNPEFHKLISTFYKITGCPVLINTSFNVRGEPIVCTPEDALRCFIYTSIDTLVLGKFIINKEELNSDFKSFFYKPIIIED